MNKTNIEYLDYTWNPIAMLCTPISPGCKNCWHRRMARRLAHNDTLSDKARSAYAGYIGPQPVESRMEEPLMLSKPSRIGLQFMGDLFHNKVPNDVTKMILQIIKWCPQHTFFLLTKRPRAVERMANWLTNREGFPDNVWLGVSVENQDTANDRIPTLLRIPAKHRWVSAEPLLEPINIYQFDGNAQYIVDLADIGPGIDWIVCGAETGSGARPMDLDWARSLRDQCVEADVPFFFKRDSESEHTLDRQLWEYVPR